MTEEEKKHLSETVWSLFFEVHYQNCHASKQTEKFNTFAGLFGLSKSETKEMKKVMNDLNWMREDFFNHNLADKLITGLKTDPLGIMAMFDALTPDKKFGDWISEYLETAKGMIQ